MYTRLSQVDCLAKRHHQQCHQVGPGETARQNIQGNEAQLGGIQGRRPQTGRDEESWPCNTRLCRSGLFASTSTGEDLVPSLREAPNVLFWSLLRKLLGTNMQRWLICSTQRCHKSDLGAQRLPSAGLSGASRLGVHLTQNESCFDQLPGLLESMRHETCYLTYTASPLVLNWPLPLTSSDCVSTQITAVTFTNSEVATVQKHNLPI